MGKVNYSPGTDVSRYKNIPVPTSYMAYHSDFNFIGNYDNEKAKEYAKKGLELDKCHTGLMDILKRVN